MPTFKLMDSGEAGKNGQNAVRVVRVEKKPVKENVMILLQIMVA